MAGFNLFNPTTTASAGAASPFSTPGLNTSSTFGVTPNQQNTSFGTTASPGNLTFGTSPNQSSFAAVKPPAFASSTSSLFAAPNTTATQPGLSFGSSTMLGSTAQGTPSLSKPAFGLSSFSSPATTQSGLSFGTSATTSIAPTGLSFGATTAPQTGLSFGATTAPQTGLSFGTPVTTQTGISFGTPATTTTQSGISFGLPAASTQTGVSFGVQSSTVATGLPQTTALASNAPTSATGGLTLSFGGASTAQTTPFSGTSTVQAAPFTGTSTSQPLSFSGTTSTSQPLSFSGTSTSQPLSFSGTSAAQPLSFGTSLTSTSTSQSVSGSLPAASTTTSAPLLFGGLTAASTAAPTTTTASSLFGLATTSTTTATGIFAWQKPASDAAAVTTASSGLGGVDHTAVTTAQSSTNTTVSVKEQPLPNEIQQTVIAFKEYVKTQKNLSSEVARSSSEPLTKLSQQIAGLNNLILSLGSILSQQKFTAEKIKMETIKALNDYELAQKIKDSPVASEERMLSIRRYFIEKISAFEESTKVLQEKIEYVYQHVITLPQENSLSAEALKMIVKKLHDSFVVISARAYKLHNDMQLLKVQYLTLRNQFIKDNTSISFSTNKEFQLPQETVRAKQSSDLSHEGPNPFSRTGNGSLSSLMLTSQNRNFPITTTSSGMGGGLFSNMSKGFGYSDLSSGSLFDQSTSTGLSSSQQFNLKQPPFGSKRKLL